MKISLARAFKERSRLSQKILETLNVIREENSIVEGGVRSIDVRQKFAELHTLNARMISLKQKIARANVGISDKLAELSEVKAMLSHLKTIPAKEGKQVESYSEDYVLVAEIKKAELTAEMESLQLRANALQDDIDEFNARTRIEFEF